MYTIRTNIPALHNLRTAKSYELVVKVLMSSFTYTPLIDVVVDAQKQVIYAMYKNTGTNVPTNLDMPIRDMPKVSFIDYLFFTKKYWKAKRNLEFNSMLVDLRRDSSASNINVSYRLK